MSGEIKGVRPHVILHSTRIELDDFRGLRHIVRNVYAFNLRSGRLDQLINRLPDCYKATQDDLLKFVQFLETI